MIIFITALHVLTCLALVAIVLLQHGKGADLGAAFGGGASQTVFGSRGAGNFLTKLTTGAAVVFMVTSLTLSYFGHPDSVPDVAPMSEPPGSPTPNAPEVPGSSFPEAAPIQGDPDVPSGFQEIDPPK